MTLSRRHVIKSFAALAALAAMPGAALPETVRDKIIRMGKQGAIVGVTFYLEGPVDMDGLPPTRFVDCTFLRADPNATFTMFIHGNAS